MCLVIFSTNISRTLMEIIITAGAGDAQFSPLGRFFERPAARFIVFHLLDAVQSIRGSLKIPPFIFTVHFVGVSATSRSNNRSIAPFRASAVLTGKIKCKSKFHRSSSSNDCFLSDRRIEELPSALTARSSAPGRK